MERSAIREVEPTPFPYFAVLHTGYDFRWPGTVRRQDGLNNPSCKGIATYHFKEVDFSCVARMERSAIRDGRGHAFPVFRLRCIRATVFDGLTWFAIPGRGLSF